MKSITTKKISLLLFVSVLIVQCKEETNYIIAEEQVGKITAATQINELESIFKNDSIVSNLGEDNIAESSYDEYLVYSKKGDHLLTIIPKTEQDSSSTIESIQIFDKNYKTVKGLSIKSAFKDIVGSYTVNKVQSTFGTAVLSVDELNATIIIDKKELGVEDFGTQKIKLEQIPDLAKIKGITLWFK